MKTKWIIEATYELAQGSDTQLVKDECSVVAEDMRGATEAAAPIMNPRHIGQKLISVIFLRMPKES